MIRLAISPRFAMRILRNDADELGASKRGSRTWDFGREDDVE
jgi:hypothetical protein